jgi:hypothetical protein
MLPAVVTQCPECQKVWPTTTTRCPRCGTPLDARARPQPVPPEVDEGDPERYAYFRTPRAERPAAMGESERERVVAHQYAEMHRHAGRMTIRAAIELTVAIMAGLALLVVLGMLAFGTTNAIIDTWGVPLLVGVMVTAYRQFMVAEATLRGRDELLMRVDVAINTAALVRQGAQRGVAAEAHSDSSTER